MVEKLERAEGDSKAEGQVPPDKQGEGDQRFGEYGCPDFSGAKISRKGWFPVANVFGGVVKGIAQITGTSFKYTRADVFSLDQTELKLAYPACTEDESAALQKLSGQFQGNGWLTRGSADAYQIEMCPAFALDVKDTVGTGDAFFATAGIFAAAGAPMDVGTLVGNIGGTLGANIIGNKSSIEKVNVLKYANTLMNIYSGENQKGKDRDNIGGIYPNGLAQIDLPS